MTRLILAGLIGWFTPTTAAEPHPVQRCSSVQECRDELARARDAIAWQRSVRRAVERRLAVRFRRDVSFAIDIASRAFRVSRAEMTAVARCESHLNPFAQNQTSTAGGLFQWLASSWASTPFGDLSRYDPLVASLATAEHVSRAGWGAWVCKP